MDVIEIGALLQDLHKLRKRATTFGQPILVINSQHTGSSAESYFGDVVFRNTQA